LGIGFSILQHFTERPFLSSKWKARKHIAAYKAYGQWENEDEEFKRYRSYYEGTVWQEEKSETIKPEEGREIGAPVIVFIGHETCSAAEDFLVSMDSLQRGIYVGKPTCRSTGQPLFIDLPGGGSERCQWSSNFYPFRSSKNYPSLVSCLLPSGLAAQTSFDLFLEPRGVSSNVDGSGVMEDALEDGCGSD